jgi:hypothetical protein
MSRNRLVTCCGLDSTRFETLMMRIGVGVTGAGVNIFVVVHHTFENVACRIGK